MEHTDKDQGEQDWTVNKKRRRGVEEDMDQDVEVSATCRKFGIILGAFRTEVEVLAELHLMYPVGQHDQEDQWRRKCHFNHQGRQNEETTDRPQGSERERLRLRPTGESSEEGIHHDGSTGLRDRGITPPRQGSHRSLQDDQVEYREEAGGTNQLGKDSTGGEITPRQIHQRIRELPTEALCKQTPCSASTARSVDTRPGPAGPRPRPAGTAPEDTSRPSARTARVVH